MGLKEAFQKAALAAFNAAGNLRQTVTYRAKNSANPTYAPATGTVTDAYTDYSVVMLFDQYNVREIDNMTILATDEKALIPAENLSPTPKVNDIIVRNEVSWEIVNISLDPAGAIWTFQIRKP